MRISAGPCYPFSDRAMNRHALAIIQRLRREGYQAFLVGGCVRDMLLGIRPKDYDVATDARPEEIMRLFRKIIPVGVQFGVVLVRMGGKNYEVATFREDHGYRDGRHPDHVCFGSPAEDARRRDFTINGLFYDPLEDRIIDYVGGRRDLEREVIRAIGSPERRFAEDRLRMLRAVRFAARFGWPIESRTRAAIIRNAPHIRAVSAERLRDELVHIFTGERPALGLRLLDELGLLAPLLPEIAALKGVEQPPELHPEGDVWTHTLLMLEKMKKKYRRRPEFVFAVLLHDVGKPATWEVTDRIRFNNHHLVGARMSEEILRRLRFSNDFIATVTALVREHMQFIPVRQMRPAKLKRFLRLPDFELHLELHRLDCLASHGDLQNWRFCKRQLKELEKERQPLRPPPLLTGHDLIAIGLSPGPLFRDLLTALEDAQLEGLVSSREEALAWVHDYLCRCPPRPEESQLTRKEEGGKAGGEREEKE